MKIQDNPERLVRIQHPTPAQTAPSGPSGFAAILQKTLDQAAPVQTTSSAEQPEAAAAPAADSACRRVEGFLDLLEDYRKSLADPRVGLRQLDSLVEAMRQRCDALRPLCGSLPDGDGLKEILNRSLVTAELEMMRFHRGDYLPT